MKKAFTRIFSILFICSLAFSFIYASAKEQAGSNVVTLTDLSPQAEAHVPPTEQQPSYPYSLESRNYYTLDGGKGTETCPGAPRGHPTNQPTQNMEPTDYKAALLSFITSVLSNVLVVGNIGWGLFWKFISTICSVETYVGAAFSLVAIFTFVFRGYPTLVSIKNNLAQVLFTPFYMLWYFLDKLEKLFDSYLGRAIFGETTSVITILVYAKGGVFIICQAIDQLSGGNLLLGEALPFGMKDSGAKSTLQEWHEFLDPSVRTRRLLAENSPIIQNILLKYPLPPASKLQQSLERLFPQLYTDRVMAHLDDIFGQIQAGTLADPDSIVVP